MHRMTLAVVAACTMSAAVSAQETFVPARYLSGRVPALPPLAVGGGEVFLELSVSNEGRVTAIRPLRTTAPFTRLLLGAVQGWRFAPAERELLPAPGAPSRERARERIASTVLVAGVFRQPTVIGPTLGEQPKDVAAEADETPFPLTTRMPPFPPLARDAGVVLVEARVGPDGSVNSTTIIRSAPPFDEVAGDAARLWRLRPARVRGRSVATLVYIVFGFPSPVGARQESLQK